MSEAPAPQRKQGRVKWFNSEKGFGFICPDESGPDAFVHYTFIESDGYRTLEENQVVTFTITPKDRGPWAENVRLGPLEVTEGQDDSIVGDAEEGVVAMALVDGRLRLLAVLPDGTYQFLDQSKQVHSLLYIWSFANLGFVDLVEEFEDLINSRSVKEEELQKFFERNPDFLTGDIYEEARPHIVLRREEQGSLIPDFALRPHSTEGLCDLLELKLPQAKTVVGSENRRRLSGSVMEACAQLREYRDYFDSEANRKVVLETYGLRFFRPRMVVVIGRRSGQTATDLRSAEGDVPQLTLRTYDDLLDRAKSRLRRMPR